MKKTVSIIVSICVFISIIGNYSVFADSREDPAFHFLLNQGIVCDDNTHVRVVTEKDNSQHIVIWTRTERGTTEVTTLTCVDGVDGELVALKLFPDLLPNTEIQLVRGTRTSNSFVEPLGNSQVTVTVTAYFNSVTLLYPEIAVIYTPSGITGKVTRPDNCTSTVTSFVGYFTIPGLLVTPDYTITTTEHNYEARFTSLYPQLSLLYSDYETLPTGYPYIYAYPPNEIDSPGLGFVITIDGYNRPFENSLDPFNI